MTEPTTQAPRPLPEPVQEYQALPFYRRGTFVTLVLALGIVAAVFDDQLQQLGLPLPLRNGPVLLGGPCLVVLAACLLTGPVYRRPLPGSTEPLRRWHWANAVLVALLLLNWLATLVRVICTPPGAVPTSSLA